MKKKLKTSNQSAVANFDMADEIAAPALDTALAQGDDEALDTLDEYADIFRATVEQIDTDEEAGVLDPEDAEDLRAQAVEDYKALIEEFLDIDDEEEMIDYASNSTLANFSAGNNFGAALLELAQDEFEDPDDAIYAIAERTGYDPEQVLGLISGEYVPDEELAAEIAEVFETTSDDDTAYNNFLSLGEEARTEEGFADDESKDEEPEQEQFSRYLADKDRRIEELEAQFNEGQIERQVSEQLMELEQLANSGVQEGWLPPVAHREMFARFKTDKDKLAAFSAVCEGNGVDLETELYATQKVLSLFERCGPQIKFGAVVEEDLTDEELDEVEAVAEQAKRNVQLRAKRNTTIRNS